MKQPDRSLHRAENTGRSRKESLESRKPPLQKGGVVGSMVRDKLGHLVNRSVPSNLVDCCMSSEQPSEFLIHCRSGLGFLTPGVWAVSTSAQRLGVCKSLVEPQLRFVALQLSQVARDGDCRKLDDRSPWFAACCLQIDEDQSLIRKCV